MSVSAGDTFGPYRIQRELGIIFIHVTHGQDEALAAEPGERVGDVLAA